MKIFSWGPNSYGQLSLGLQSEQCITPIEIKSGNYEIVNTVKIVGGGGHTLILDKLGNVYGCGWNNNGQLTGITENHLLLTKITALQNYCIVQVACGWDASYVVTQEGSVFVWGSNKHGQLGIPQEKKSIVRDPVKLNVEEVLQISAGLRHASIVTRNGDVFVTGKGQKGQLGIVSEISCPVLYSSVFRKVSGIKNVKQVACGQQHTIAITNDNILYVWGDNKYGQLGLDPDQHPCVWAPQVLFMSHLSPFCSDVAVHVGWTHCAILTGGKVINWGRNTYCQLGEVRISSWQPQELSSLTGVQQLSVGSEHNVALLSTGEVVSWGWNEHGNCGCGTVENVTTPTSVKLQGSCVLLGSGSGHNFAMPNEYRPKYRSLWGQSWTEEDLQRALQVIKDGRKIKSIAKGVAFLGQILEVELHLVLLSWVNQLMLKMLSQVFMPLVFSLLTKTLCLSTSSSKEPQRKHHQTSDKS